MRDILTHTQDLAEAAAPDEVSIILRNAAESCNEAHNELLAAWQQTYTPWATIARILERAADQIDKVTLVIAFALITQGVQADEYNWRLQRELRNLEDQQDEIIEQNEKISRQNERLASQLRSDEFQRQLDAEKAERANRVDRWISERKAATPQVYVVIEKPEPTPEPKPIPSAPLPSNGLSEEDIKRIAPYFGQFKAK